MTVVSAGLPGLTPAGWPLPPRLMSLRGAGLAAAARGGGRFTAGAGKSTLVVKAALALAGAGEPVMVVAQTNGQVDDLVDRLAVAAPGLMIGRLSGAGLRARAAGHPACAEGRGGHAGRRRGRAA